MNRMERKLVQIATILGCLVLAGCGKNAGEETVSVIPSKAPLAASETVGGIVAESSGAAVSGAGTEAWNPEVIQRQILADEGAMCGVIFLGFADESVGNLESDREYYQSLFETRGYLDGFPFLTEIPDTNYVHTEHGQEFYFILPDGKIGRVELEWSDGMCLIEGTQVTEIFEGIVFAG